MRGKATLLSTHIVNPKTSSVQIISPRPGLTRKLPPSSSAWPSGPSVPSGAVSWARTRNCPMSLTQIHRSA